MNIPPEGLPEPKAAGRHAAGFLPRGEGAHHAGERLLRNPGERARDDEGQRAVEQCGPRHIHQLTADNHQLAGRPVERIAAYREFIADMRTGAYPGLLHVVPIADWELAARR